MLIEIFLAIGVNTVGGLFGVEGKSPFFLFIIGIIKGLLYSSRFFQNVVTSANTSSCAANCKISRMVDNIIVIVLVLIIIAGASLYVYKEKKKGKKCIGCPDSANCPSGMSCSECVTTHKK